MATPKIVRVWKGGELVGLTIDGVAQEITDELKQQHGTQPVVPIDKSKQRKPVVIEPIPRNDWPMWAKAISQFSKPEDAGIGDVVARMIGDEKSAAFKAWHQWVFGKPCGCTGRQKRWNQFYPLK